MNARAGPSAPRPPAHDRWQPLEIVFWLVPVAALLRLSRLSACCSQILIIGLFALSLDLILGYAGIVSLGHAAFFGLGAYTAGLLASAWLGRAAARPVARPRWRRCSGFCTSFLVVRGQDLTRLMVTLGIGLMLFEAANKAALLTGGVDGLSGIEAGKVLGLFGFDLYGKTAFFYSLVVLFVCSRCCAALVQLAVRPELRGIREGAHACRRSAPRCAQRLTAVFTSARRSPASPGALLAQTTQFVGSTPWAFRARPMC